MNLAKFILFAAVPLASVLSGCISIPEEEMQPYVRAIDASGRDKLNLPELPPPEDRRWGSSSESCTFYLVDLRNGNFTYYFRFKPEPDGTFSLVSERGVFGSGNGPYLPTPARMIRIDYIVYEYDYDIKDFLYILYYDWIYTPGRWQQSPREIEMDEALKYIKRWNETMPKIKRKPK